MPGRLLLSDFRSRNHTICRSCLSRLRSQIVPPSFAMYSEQATGKLPSRGYLQPRRASIRRQQPRNVQGARLPPKNVSISDAGLEAMSDIPVRFFEQDESGRRELADDDAFSKSLGKADTSGLKDALQAIELGIRSKDERDIFQNVMRELAPWMNRIDNANDLERMTTRMDEYTREIDDEIREATNTFPQSIIDELNATLQNVQLDDEAEVRAGVTTLTPQVLEKPWTMNQRRKIAKFNAIISRVHKDLSRGAKLSKKDVSAVFRAYHGTRVTLARGWRNVPLEVWDFLWTLFSADESINIHRLAHIALLSRDMSEAKVTLTPRQQLLTIEAVFVDGWELKAIESWKRCLATLGDEISETFQEFWELGVHMYCRVPDMDQAERAANKVLEKHMNPRILMPLIRTWSEIHTEYGRQKAWSAYRQMRDLLGKDMKLSDYDQIVAYFLTTSQTENALYAFVDMMSDGEIDLTKQKYMPSVVANKFFLGKWLKRLIGADDLNGAYNVIEFMRKKGVQASPIHLNVLIGSWLRSGGAKDIDMAEKLAWHMIDERIAFVRLRKRKGLSSTVTAKHGAVPLPRATLETFCVLAENYRLRELHDRQAKLWAAFHEAELSPDAFMLNQLLESHIQAGEPQKALALYKSLVTERGIKPDPYTFSALWKTLAVNRLHVITPVAQAREIEATRHLFAETVAFKSVFANEGMGGQLARKILHSFRRLQDKVGLLVAMTALKDVFRFLPSETLVMEMVMSTHKLVWNTAEQRNRLLSAKREIDHALFQAAGGDASKLEGEGRGNALYDYLQNKYWPQEDDDMDRQTSIISAAKAMGVLDLLAPKKKGQSHGLIGRSQE